jgi:hypothetical protein
MLVLEFDRIEAHAQLAEHETQACEGRQQAQHEEGERRDADGLEDERSTDTQRAEHHQ